MLNQLLAVIVYCNKESQDKYTIHSWFKVDLVQGWVSKQKQKPQMIKALKNTRQWFRQNQVHTPLEDRIGCALEWQGLHGTRRELRPRALKLILCRLQLISTRWFHGCKKTRFRIHNLGIPSAVPGIVPGVNHWYLIESKTQLIPTFCRVKHRWQIRGSQTQLIDSKTNRDTIHTSIMISIEIIQPASSDSLILRKPPKLDQFITR